MPAKRKTKRAAKKPASKAKKASPPRAERPQAKTPRGAVPQPLIAVRDVISSSRWYQTLLGARNLGGERDHDELYDRIYAGDRLILQLHSWDDEEHPNLTHAERGPLGHGVLLWFELEDFDAAVERATGLEAEVLQPVHVNEAPGHREIWLRDPDGYVVVLASPDGEAG